MAADPVGQLFSHHLAAEEAVAVLGSEARQAAEGASRKCDGLGFLAGGQNGLEGLPGLGLAMLRHGWDGQETGTGLTSAIEEEALLHRVGAGAADQD